MRAGLAEREPVRIAHWERHGLYGQIQARAAGKPAFVLHDGPPFTNGDVHIGTALNKLLKDSILRYKSMRGFRTPYVPGWDCHGLPIEHKVMKELQAKKQSLDALGVRKACAEFSAAYIEKQRGQFKRLGILADWASEYRTMDPAYEGEILGGFASFVEQGLVYRSKKPVYWSIPCQTALAEAEIEYKDKRSHSVWVAFPVADPAAKQLAPAHPLSVVIWTTTPWTLPANLAIAVHPDLEYVEVRHGERSFLVASALREAFVAACALEGAVDGFKVKGRALEGLQPQHPFIDRASPVVLADYVTTDAGTGCVHTAPGHGIEDYQTGNKYGFEPYCPVRDDGTYADDGTTFSFLQSFVPFKDAADPTVASAGLIFGNVSVVFVDQTGAQQVWSMYPQLQLDGKSLRRWGKIHDGEKLAGAGQGIYAAESNKCYLAVAGGRLQLTNMTTGTVRWDGEAPSGVLRQVAFAGN